ncbi:MAG: hypothetical protein JNL88_12950 [Bacteroidia bacterium]|nr:hypothetical protein [Bacteroidia bacterium]
MKKLMALSTLLWASSLSFGQTIASGEYDAGLKLAYDSTNHTLTGYYESYTGWDEASGQAKFSCIFYIRCMVTGRLFTVDTYYPNDPDNLIQGQVQMINDTTLGLQLHQEHGGCWNVQHFADEPVEFRLEKRTVWKQIRYIVTDKAYFYSDPSLAKKQKSYLVKNDVVCIDQITDEWAHCTFYGQATSKGWIRITDLNK